MDEFSFPTISTDQDSLCQLPFPHFAASPLWFLSSVNDNTDCQLPRSSSEGEEAACIIDMLNPVSLSNGEEEEEEGGCNKEEKMDMLWEDFNEELRCEIGKTGDRQAYGVAKGGGGGGGSLFNYRRPSLVMLLKMLKKLFFLQKTSFIKRASLFQKLQSHREQ